MNGRVFVSTGISVVFLLSVIACDRAGGEAVAQSSAAVEGSGSAVAQPGAPVVDRVVFVDQEQCCDCTQSRIDVTWDALSAALAGHDIAVERLHRDSQEEQVAPFQEMDPIMVVPGVYFLDRDGELVEMLQGELTVEQVAEVVGGTSAVP